MKSFLCLATPLFLIENMFKGQLNNLHSCVSQVNQTLWCSAGYTQVYTLYPLIFQSALSIPTSKSALILSVANQLFQETVYKRTYWPLDYLEGFVFHVSMYCGIRNRSLKILIYVIVSPYSLTEGQYGCKICISVVANASFIMILLTC